MPPIISRDVAEIKEFVWERVGAANDHSPSKFDNWCDYCLGGVLESDPLMEAQKPNEPKWLVLCLPCARRHGVLW